MSYAAYVSSALLQLGESWARSPWDHLLTHDISVHRWQIVRICRVRLASRREGWGDICCNKQHIIICYSKNTDVPKHLCPFISESERIYKSRMHIINFADFQPRFRRQLLRVPWHSRHRQVLTAAYPALTNINKKIIKQTSDLRSLVIDSAACYRCW